MHSYNHLYEQYLSEENYYLAIKNVTRNKGSKKKKKNRSIYYKNHADELKQKLLDYAENFKPDHHTPQEIYDGIRRKKRTILVPSMREQVIHHMIVNVLKPIILKPMYRHSYGSLPGRGATRGKKKHTLGGKEAVEKFIKTHPNQCQYCLKMDIHKFFDNVSHDVIKQKFARIIHDKKFLNILYRIIDSNEKDIGLPIGFYTSQWFANFYLIDLDHFIKEKLHAPAYFRYMDDLVIFSSNKDYLHQVRAQVQIYLKQNLQLQLNPKWQIFQFTERRFLDFMGFQFHPTHTILRRSLMLRMTRKARRIGFKQFTTAYDCKQMISYKGWLNVTNTYNMYKHYIKPFISFKALQKRVGRIQHVVSQREWGYNQALIT